MSDAMRTPPTGLVLSGGGAKGAYQVGVMKALLELGASVDMVAGASMGALNGAVLACAPSLPEGVQRLETLWNTLASESPVETNTPAYLKLLATTGLTLGIPFGGLFAKISTLLQGVRWVHPAMQVMESFTESALLSDGPLKTLMDEYLDIDRLSHGLPLYISVFESKGGLTDLLRCAIAEAGLIDTPPSRFLHVQSLPVQEQRNALMASAAIPLLYQARQIGNTRYSDGGQGGWQKAQGNTPITPLIEAGCKKVIVTHLTDGSLWSRHDFPDTTILEIRPQAPITPDGSPWDAAKAALGFDMSNIARLMRQGYDDTKHCVGRVIQATQAREKLRQSAYKLNQSLKNSESTDIALANAMSRLQ